MAPYSKPSSQYLTYLYPVWCGCTLGEILLVAGATLIVSISLLLMIGICIGHVATTLLLIIPVLFTLPKRAVKKLAAFKENKPHGYLQVSLMCWLSRYSQGLYHAPYVTRKGLWSVKRSVRQGGEHV